MRPSRCWSAPAAYMQATGQAFDDGAGHHARRQPVHHAHRGGGRLRSLRARAHRAVPGRATPKNQLGITTRTIAGAGARRIRSDWSESFQHGVPGDPRQRRGQRRQPPARRGQPADFRTSVPALAGGRSAGRARHQWRAHADLGLPAAEALWTQACGKDRWQSSDDPAASADSQVSATPICGDCRNAGTRRRSIEYARERSVARSSLISGAAVRRCRERRTAVRSGGTDLGLRAPFRDLQASESAVARPARLLRLLTNADRPVQLIIAGKAHPADEPGQALIQAMAAVHPRHRCTPACRFS